MFSPNDFVHLVFINENDKYYCDNGLKLDINQYLWFELHEQYKSVYFISPKHGGSISTFGDAAARKFDAEVDTQKTKRLFGGKKKSDLLGTWMLKQLTSGQNGSAAFVCSLDDFCEIFEDEVHQPALCEMAKSNRRNGIIVLTAPANIEKASRPILESPVFNYLNETAITDLRNGITRDMFGALYSAKKKSCCFLNAFTKEAARGIIVNALLECSGIYPSASEINDAAEYLSQYVNNPRLHRTDRVMKCAAPDMPRCDVYRQLSKTETLKRLLEKAIKMRSCGGMREYVEKLGCPLIDTEAETTHINHDSDSCAGRCMLLHLPDEATTGPEHLEQLLQLLSEIKKEAGTSINRLENSKISNEVKRFISDAESAAERKDCDTYRRALYAVWTGMQWQHTAADSADEKSLLIIFDKFRTLIYNSYGHFTSKQALENSKHLLSGMAMSKMSIQQLSDKVAASDKILTRYEDIVFASTIKLSEHRISQTSIEELAENLTKELDDVKTSCESTEPEDSVTPKSAQEDNDSEAEDDEDVFVFDDDDYVFHL